MRIIDEITEFVFINDELQKSDIIFIPGGSHPELGEYAAKLYNLGYAEKIMPSGGVSIKTGKFDGVKSKHDLYYKSYITECDFLTDVLQINGVPRSAIIQENKAGYTKENAYFSKIIVDKNDLIINKAIICCKNFHARRSLMCYQFAFPNTEFFVYPIPYFDGNVEITSDNWHETEKGVKRVLGEVQRYGNQFIDEFLQLIN